MFFRTLAAILLLAPLARADVPRVVTSIAPLQGIVADIMAGVSEPTLLLDQNTSAHEFALRPSQLRAISGADIIFYIGLNMEPWLLKPLAQTDSKQLIALGEDASPHRLAARDLHDFGHGGHDHDHDHNTVIDPHVWLHPENALLWVDIIAGVLINADADNQAAYSANADALRADIIASTNTQLAALSGLQDLNIIVSHDSIQYFEDAFHLNVIGSFSASDGQHAGARTVSEILDQIGQDTCILIDINDTAAATRNLGDEILLIEIDPLGYDQLGSAGYYPHLLETLTESVLQCQK